MPSGELRGRISTPSLIINEGARYEGQMEMPSHNTRLAAGRTRPSLGGPSGADEGPEGGEQPARPAGTGFIRRFGAAEGREDQPQPGQGDAQEFGGES
jgi:hypothetical protein